MGILKTSEKAKDIMRKMEKLYTYIYDDQTSKKTLTFVKGSTIGYGHLITSQSEFNLYKNGITEKQALDLFDKDLKPFEDNVNKVNKKSNITQYEFDALVMLCFNIGSGNFNSSSVLKINNGIKTNYSDISSAFAAWNKSQGKVMNGLTKRRKLESDLYKSGKYVYFQ